VRFLTGVQVLLSTLFVLPQNSTTPAEVAVPKLPDDVAVYVDAFHTLGKNTTKCPMRAYRTVRWMVRDEFANTEKRRLVNNPDEAQYALVIAAPPRKETAVLVPIASYRENVHWLNRYRGEVNLDKLFSDAVWDSAQAVNMGKRYAIAYATLGNNLFAGKMHPRDFVVKLKDEMMGGARHRSNAERAFMRTQREQEYLFQQAECDLDRVFKGTPPQSEPVSLPPAPIKIYFEPVSVPPKPDCVRELRLTYNGTMKLEKAFEGDPRFQLVKKRDDADFVFSIFMFRNRNLALLVTQEDYARFVEWEDSGLGNVDLLELWASALWRSNQSNQVLKNAGATLLSYGFAREVGNKSATDLIALFRNEFHE
jgi:hypothetical protein